MGSCSAADEARGGHAAASEPAAAARWRTLLAAWAIPAEILAQAPADPWEYPVAPFRHGIPRGTTPSLQRAREVLRDGDIILDVGAGGCAMSLALRPPAARIVAVDAQASMLADSPADETIVGRWPDVAAQAGQADVVVCGHVVYNVGDLVPFVRALQAAARRRVVVELTREHPQGSALMRDLWRRFWDVERPDGPDCDDAQAVIASLGIDPRLELFERERRLGHTRLEDLVAHLCRLLCLPPSRSQEVHEVALQHAVCREGLWLADAAPSRLATIWWDAP